MMDLTASTLVIPHVPREARHRWGIRRASQCPFSATWCEFNGPRGRVRVTPTGSAFVVTVARRKKEPVTVTVDGSGIVPAIDKLLGVAS